MQIGSYVTWGSPHHKRRRCADGRVRAVPARTGRIVHIDGTKVRVCTDSGNYRNLHLREITKLPDSAIERMRELGLKGDDHEEH